MNGIETIKLEMPYRHNGHTQNAPIILRAPAGLMEDEADPTLLVMGYGIGRFSARKVARIPEGSSLISVQFVFTDAESIEPLCQDGVRLVAASLNRRRGLDEERPVKTISQSQGAGIVAFAGNQQVPQLKDARHALLSPVGFNSAFLGPEDKRMFEVIKRFGKNAKQEGQMDFQNWPANVDVLYRLFYDSFIKWGLLRNKFNYALSDERASEGIRGLRWLANNSHMAFFIGEHDPVFPKKEVVTTLSSSGLGALVTNGTVRIMPGAHEPHVSKLGKRQLADALEFIKGV